MGTLEKKSKKAARRNQIREVILTSVKVVGLLAVATVIPNAVSGLHKLGLLPGSRQAESVRRSYQRLIKTGLLEFDGKFLMLTADGERELRKYELKNYKLKKPRS